MKRTLQATTIRSSEPKLLSMLNVKKSAGIGLGYEASSQRQQEELLHYDLTAHRLQIP